MSAGLKQILEEVVELPGHYLHPLIGRALHALAAEVEALHTKLKEIEDGTSSTKQEASPVSAEALHRLSQAGEEAEGAADAEVVKAEQALAPAKSTADADGGQAGSLEKGATPGLVAPEGSHD